METGQMSNRTVPFSFTGRTMEYFGIWIVNVLLIIVTLGIYSAWAKVRTNRYFYGHTLLDEAGFDYLADPIAILIGWAIGVAFFLAYSLTGQFFPLISVVLGLVLFLFIPWIVVRAMAFRLRNTAHRNIRFSFNKNYNDAALVFIGLPMLMPLTLGLLFPYMIYRQKQFIVVNSRYGRSPFQFQAGAGGFYKIAFIALGVLLLTGIIIGVLAGMFTAAQAAEPELPAELSFLPNLIMLSIFLIYFVLFAYWQTAVTNLVWNNIQLDRHHFRCTLKFSYMLWLYFSNTVAILASLGLLVPWARVRTVRYRMDNLFFIPGGDLNNFIAARQKEESAIGEEIGEVMDIDIGL